MKRYAMLGMALMMWTAAAQAGKVKVWHQYRPTHFEKGKLNGVVVSNEGTLRLSKVLRPLAGIEATHVYDVLEDKQGDLYVATGGAGKVYRVAADGKVSLAYTSEDGLVLCLAQGNDGAVYAGTGPTGRVVRLDAKGARVVADGLGSYVWSLAFDAKNDYLYAATGPKGKLYRITADGKSSVFYQAKQDHLLCVAVGADGQVYAGSDRDGLVYRLDGKGKPFVMYQAAQAEIRSLHVTADAVYVGTSSPSSKKRGSVAGTSSSDSAEKVEGKKEIVPVSGKSELAEAIPLAPSKGSAKDDEKEDKGKSASAPSAPSSGENSVYRIAADGSVREVFREKALVLSLLNKSGKFFVGTGMGGQLFEVDEKTKERSEIARLDHGQILCMAQRANGSIVLGMGDPGKLYVLEDKFGATGTVVSEVFDAKLVSKWGALRWHGQAPVGTRLTVAVRSGNVAEPDETWSDWSVEKEDGATAQAEIPSARFAQYRITLGTDDQAKSPSLRNLSLRYATANQAPEVTKVEVPNLDAEDLDNPKKVKVKWSAEDANEDNLTYKLFVRKEGWTSWVLLDDDLDKSDFEWDSTTTPSGVYRVKVVASDRKDNPDEDALESERVSDAFVVSHIPPAVSVKVASINGNRTVLEATGSSDWARLTGASFSVNGKKWTNVFPEDGLFDGKKETFRFETESLKPGTYVVVLRVKDASGNTGSSDVVFTLQAKKDK